MLTQIKNAKFYLQAKLGLSQRGAEMVEYAIVLACIAAVGVAYYSYNASGAADAQGKPTNTLTGVLDSLWNKVKTSAGSTTVTSNKG